MRVTMNIFSGRPNPSWRLTRPQADELVERVAGGDAPTAPEQAPRLGFGGFTIDADIEDVARGAGVPAHFVVAPPAEVADTAARPRRQSKSRPSAARPSEAERSATRAGSQWLLSTAPPIIADEVLLAAEAAIHQPAAWSGVARTKGGVEAEAAEPETASREVQAPGLRDPACEPFLTPIQIAFWDHPSRRWSNNCYNYAANFASNTMSQPGRRSGHMYTSFDCGNVAAAAGFDGVQGVCRGTMRVVALAIWPGFDFHWWRLHPAGFWAHKIGTSPVLQVDNLGRVLGQGLSPANCDRGPYTQFCSFFYLPLGVQVL